MNCVYHYGTANLFYCNQKEYENIKESNTDVSALLCAKNPFHKEIVGYVGNCPKDHPEYLMAYRHDEHILALNMVDAPCKKFFSDKMIYAGLDFIQAELAQGRDVVVVCNKGESRSATICLMYMMAHGDFDNSMTHEEAFSEFKKIAPDWKPGEGILQYCIEFWDKMKRGESIEPLC